MNTLGFPILSLLTFLPLAGVAIIATLSGTEDAVARNARWVALWTSLIVLALGVYLWIAFDPSQPGFQFVENHPWFTGVAVDYHMGVDGISLLLILLTVFLTPIAILSSWPVTKRVREFMIAFLLLETMTVGMFSALDFVLFYIFFEAVLIPMYLIIGVWGGERRIFAAVKFFLFTLAGSVLMLLALVWMWRNAGTTDIVTLLHTPIPPRAQMWLFIAFLASFGVKAAVWPLHTWLPDAYGEAPLPGTNHAGRRTLKNGRLRLPPLHRADAPASLCRRRTFNVHPRRGRGHLCLARRPGANRHEAPHRLLLGRPYGGHHHRHFHLHCRRHRRRFIPDALPRASSSPAYSSAPAYYSPATKPWSSPASAASPPACPFTRPYSCCSP